ncbi:STAS domain-containing protein [Sphaerisporangium sp. NPDC005288]|uniref:STAS domain-containing protein n=1 Tax=Sphaerisporangium sp. NPDC005288 TaxID=3155114 RepID=UPI0033B4F410
MAAQFEVSIAYRPPVVLLALAGELDLATADILVASAKDLIGRGHAHLALDVTDLRFCDSTGLEAMIAASERTAGAGGSLRLVGVRGILQRVLEVTRLEHPFRPDLDGRPGDWSATAPSPVPSARPVTPPRVYARALVGRARETTPRAPSAV